MSEETISQTYLGGKYILVLPLHKLAEPRGGRGEDFLAYKLAVQVLVKYGAVVQHGDKMLDNAVCVDVIEFVRQHIGTQGQGVIFGQYFNDGRSTCVQHDIAPFSMSWSPQPSTKANSGRIRSRTSIYTWL